MKRKIYDLILSLPWPLRKVIIDLSDFCKNPSLCLSNRKQIKQFFRESDAIYEIDDTKISYTDCKKWEKAFLYHAISSPTTAKKMADSFCKCRVKTLKDYPLEDSNSPIFICAVKDDLERIKMSYVHHRSIGVKNYVFLDNGSTDGTLKWLLEQNVAVYQILDRYRSEARVGWISKIMMHYGFDRWYLIVDSDELFVYPECETKSIDEYVAHLETKQIKRNLSFMLDMYSTNKLFEEGDNGSTIQEKYRYFDGDSYKKENCLHYQKITGGPRQRLFAKRGSMEMLQNKYPLVFLQKGEIYRYHYVSPYKENFGMECTSALLHYKFLEGDYAKYVEIAKNGNYANGSRLYKDIIEKVDGNSELYFYNEKSIEYRNSEDLLKNTLISNWKE